MQDAVQIYNKLDELTGHAWRVRRKVHDAFQALSAAPFPADRWRPLLRPGREELCRFIREVRATRRAYRQVFGYDPEYLERIERDALLVAQRLSWVSREAPAATSREVMDDWLGLLENLRDFIQHIARATKRAWRVFREVHLSESS